MTKKHRGTVQQLGFLLFVCCVAGCCGLAVDPRIARVTGARQQDSPAVAEAPIWVARRYWGDEMSSCIEIYCLNHLGTEHYLNCLQNYCPDAVVRIPSKRQQPTAILVASDNDYDAPDDHVATITCSSSRRYQCDVTGGALCYDVSSSGLASMVDAQPTLDVAFSQCAVKECNILDRRRSAGLSRCAQVACC